MPDSHLPPSASAPTKGRDGRTALLVLAAIALAMALGYRPGPAAGPQEGQKAADAAAAPEVIYAAPDGPDIGGFDMNRAMALAGEQLPAGVESYYFFAFVDDVPAEQEIADLAEKLAQASQEHDYLGISGPDSERNRRNLLSALQANQGKDLKGVVIIYVGPAAHRAELTQAVQASGAQFRFVVYPGGPAKNKPEV